MQRKRKTPNVLAIKVIRSGGQAYYQQQFKWPLPKDGKPGKWRHVKGRLRMCAKGIHATNPRHSGEWSAGQYGTRTFIIELAGLAPSSRIGSKHLARSGRLLQEILGVYSLRGLRNDVARERLLHNAGAKLAAKMGLEFLCG